MARTPAESPFTPGYGILPTVWAGRDREFRDFDEVVAPRVSGRVYEQARVVTGNRGVGKTVFLVQLADEAREAGHLVAKATARRGNAVVGDLVADLARTLHAASPAAAFGDALGDTLQRRIGLKVTAGGVELDLGEARERPSMAVLADTLATVLERTAREAADRGRLLLVTIDELQNADEQALEVVCHTLARVQTTHDRTTGPRGEAVRAYLPLAAYVAGLPSLPEQIRRSGSTFFERALALDFGLLRDPDVATAMRAFLDNVDVGIEAEALDRLVGLIGGYPYFLHLFGKHAWEAGTSDVVTLDDVEQAARAAEGDLARFYGERLRGLGDLAYDWLVAAATLAPGDRTVGNVAARLDRTSAQLGSTVQGLIQQSLVRHEPGRGRFSFAVPGLDRHLRQSP